MRVLAIRDYRKRSVGTYLFLRLNGARQRCCKMSGDAGNATLTVAVRVDVGVARAGGPPSGVILPGDR
jgi:hypothetical protein